MRNPPRSRGMSPSHITGSYIESEDMATQQPLSNLDRLEFDNRFTHELPADPVNLNQPRQVMGAAFSRVQPAHVSNPQLISFSHEVAARLGLDEARVRSPEFAQVFAGNVQLPGMDPFAMCYGGHQFGNWAGQLGDGRAINLGEARTNDDARLTLQLKGAGPTPYSRTADGLAVLRSSVREFLCSEAMHHLGVPTTRALSLVETGETVVRDMFYSGNPQPEPGAIVCRVAPSFVRFGNFQIFAARDEIEPLRSLADFTIRNDFPHLGEPSPATYAAWFAEVCRRTAKMIVEWMRVGFVHGVMNTDNMSILGLTIDYGPYGWLEGYDPNWTPNTTDAGSKRYRFGNQPGIAQWNLMQLANAIYPLVGEVEPLQEAIDNYAALFERDWKTMMMRKLGFESIIDEADQSLIDEVQRVLMLTETDMTIFYRRLADLDATQIDAATVEDRALIAPLQDAYYDPDGLTSDVVAQIASWLRAYIARTRERDLEPTTRRTRMNAVNPNYVLRNYMAQLAIDQAETGDYTLVNQLLELLRRPYDDQPEFAQYAVKRPEWARNRAGCSMLSCSS